MLSSSEDWRRGEGGVVPGSPPRNPAAAFRCRSSYSACRSWSGGIALSSSLVTSSLSSSWYASTSASRSSRACCSGLLLPVAAAWAWKSRTRWASVSILASATSLAPSVDHGLGSLRNIARS